MKRILFYSCVLSALLNPVYFVAIPNDKKTEFCKCDPCNCNPCRCIRCACCKSDKNFQDCACKCTQGSQCQCVAGDKSCCIKNS